MHLNLHATEEQLAEIAKRERRTDRIATSTIVSILLCITAGIGFLIYRDHIRQVRLETQGQRAAAVLDDTYAKVSRLRTGEVRYEVKYSFVVSDITYYGTDTVSAQPHIWRATVIYDPVDPSNNKIEGGKGFSSTWPETFGILIFAYVCSGISYLYRRFKRRKRYSP